MYISPCLNRQLHVVKLNTCCMINMMCFFPKSLVLQCRSTCGGKDNKAYTQAIVIILRNTNYT